MTVPKRVRVALGARPGDILAYEVRGNVVTLRRVDPFDAAFHAAFTQTADEWASPEDDEASREL